MQTKLTLRLDKDLIQSAKQYSKRSGKSLSQLVADYFLLLSASKTDEALEFSDEQLPPLTRSLKGALKGSDVSVADYKKYLEDKYL